MVMTSQIRLTSPRGRYLAAHGYRTRRTDRHAENMFRLSLMTRTIMHNREGNELTS